MLWAILAGIGKALGTAGKVAGAGAKGLASGLMKGKALTSSPLALAGKGANLAATTMKVGSQIGAFAGNAIRSQIQKANPLGDNKDILSTIAGMSANSPQPQQTEEGIQSMIDNPMTNSVAPTLQSGVYQNSNPLAINPVLLQELLRQQKRYY